MKFYRRFYEDGSCRVICLSCYEMLGTGLDREAAERLGTAHVCREWVLAGGESGARQAAEAEEMERPRRAWLAGLHPMVLLPMIALLFYAAPTGLEILARVHVNTWLAVILPGDLVGCAALIWLAKLPRTGVLLYIGLTALESCLHLTHTMRGMTMAWVADLVPTLVMMGVAMRRGERRERGQEASFG